MTPANLCTKTVGMYETPQGFNLCTKTVGAHGSSSPFLTERLKISNITTVCAERNAHLIPNFFMAPLGKEGQKFTWFIM